MKYVRSLRLLMPIVVAVVVGPLVAGLCFCLLAVATNLLDLKTATPLAGLITMFGLYILFAYFEGSVLAALAGALVSVWMIWRPPGLVVAIAAAIGAVGLYRIAAGLGVLDPAAAGLVLNNLGLTLVLAPVSAAVCWLLTRRFALLV